MEKRSVSAVALSAVVFMLVIALAVGWLGAIRRDGVRRQREALELALNRSLMLCYSLDGKYPETLEELLEKTPLGYDRELFTIDYRLQGSNILPDITILENTR